ncbi:hypothetical protein [Desulfobacter postgatei]|uniref:hypothetical protein n=1 Tax=Desulfobacter postgatei TaxID=2293 RepID=UPI002A36C84D|nr:hypothetical protein [Desulfobacter postgatei]MDX9963954.1 hypothetical protein [Desulfobacter postgatei]
MEKSFQIIAGRYYEKALSLERESLAHTKELFDSDPINARQGWEFTLLTEGTLKASLSNYWVTGNQELYFKNPERDLLLETATLFFSEYLKGENPIEKTISESQRYGLLSVIYGKFNQICEKLTELDIHPQEGPGLYFASLHRLTEDILNYSPPQGKSPGTIENENKACRRELAMAAQILDDFLIPPGNVLEIPRDYWEPLIKKTFEAKVLPDPKTISKYRKRLELILSNQFWGDRQSQWICLPGDSRTAKPTYQKITITLTK